MTKRKREVEKEKYIEPGQILQVLFDPYKTKDVVIKYTKDKVTITGSSIIKRGEDFEFVGTCGETGKSDYFRQSKMLDDALRQFYKSKFYYYGMTGELWSDLK